MSKHRTKQAESYRFGRRTVLTCIAAAWLAVSGVARADVTQVSNAQLEKLLEQGAVLVDVRLEEEWRDSGVIEGSHTLTFFDRRYRYDAPAWLAALEEIAPGDTPVVLICESGSRTNSITRFLDAKVGRKNVHNLTRGIRSWINNRKPVVAWPVIDKPVKSEDSEAAE